jgi:hypothetical protein
VQSLESALGPCARRVLINRGHQFRGRASISNDVLCGEFLLAAVPEVGIPSLQGSRQIILERSDSDLQ